MRLIVIFIIFGFVAQINCQFFYPYAYNSPQLRSNFPGQVVEGSYTIIDSNGVKRKIHYSADGSNGFNVVEQEPERTEKPKTMDNKNGTIKADIANKTSTGQDQEEPDLQDKVRYVPVPVYPPTPTATVSRRSYFVPYYSNNPYYYRYG